MRTIRLYHPVEDTSADLFILNEVAAHHAAVVLRLQAGAQITLFNGHNEEFLATIVQVNKKQVQVSIQSKTIISRESPCALHLGQSIIKGDRMEWVIQKAVELGVAEITPLVTEHQAVRYDAKKMEKKQAQWRAIMVSACEQCGRNKLPILHEPQPAIKWLSNQNEPHFLLLPGAQQRLKQAIQPPASSATIAIGPEGGWSQKEIDTATDNAWLPIQLGPRILRSETASVSALTLLQGYLGDI